MRTNSGLNKGKKSCQVSWEKIVFVIYIILNTSSVFNDKTFVGYLHYYNVYLRQIISNRFFKKEDFQESFVISASQLCRFRKSHRQKQYVNKISSVLTKAFRNGITVFLIRIVLEHNVSPSLYGFKSYLTLKLRMYVQH